MKTTSISHDALFKQLMEHPETVLDFLERYLPKDPFHTADLSKLQLESASFVEKELRVHYSDVLYSLRTEESVSYVYCLIEHQSIPDNNMAFRLMRYTLDVMQHHLDAGNERLPLVIPILFYCGQVSPYPHSTCWLNEFGDPAVARQLYGSHFPLIDVSTIPDDPVT